ncbi:hypothetical protein CICLE_v10013294mg [Citrus x clementina]|uniref:Uncharacterized protein n=1 Tax=Citrus clementina TaxID=85681 RepID=V4UVR9_CITCL|nr:hypothetical protein CICLE_v10013294mg [Citrus x clementina]
MTEIIISNFLKVLQQIVCVIPTYGESLNKLLITALELRCNYQNACVVSIPSLTTVVLFVNLTLLIS